MSHGTYAPVLALLLAAPALAGVTVTVEPIPAVPYVGAAAPIGFGFNGDSLFGGVYPALDENIAPYRWTAAGGYQLLPAGGFLGSEFSDAALDTTNIVGLRYEPPAKSGSSHPVIRWLPSGPLHGNPIVGGLSIPGTWEYRPVVSGNGKVILRTYREPSSLHLYGNVFAWTAEQPQWIERGGYPAPAGADDYPAWVLDVDGSGATFVGIYATSYAATDPYGPGSRRPFVYRNGAFATLPVPTSSLDGFAEKISSNGRVVLGRTTDGLTQYVWRRSTPTGPFSIASIPVPPGGSGGRIRNFTYHGRLGFGTYRNAAAQTRTMIWRDTGGAIDAQGWIDGLGLPALGWTGFVPDSFSDDGRTVLGTAISGGVTHRVRVRGYDLAAILGPTPSLGEFATSPIVMLSSTLSSTTLDTRLFMEGRPQDAVAGNDVRDGWFSWTSPQSGIAKASHCGPAGSVESQVTLAIYRADGVRIAAAGAGSHPDCATPNGAQVDFAAIEGHTYRIRVSLADAQLGYDTYGTGLSGLLVNLGVEPTCGAAGAGGCLVAHPTPGCADQACCLTVCAPDPYCCDNQWDQLCVNGAAALCDLAPGDLNGDGDVNAADLAILLAAWGSTGPNAADLNGNGSVEAMDLGILLANWG